MHTQVNLDPHSWRSRLQIREPWKIHDMNISRIWPIGNSFAWYCRIENRNIIVHQHFFCISMACSRFCEIREHFMHANISCSTVLLINTHWSESTVDYFWSSHWGLFNLDLMHGAYGKRLVANQIGQNLSSRHKSFLFIFNTKTHFLFTHFQDLTGLLQTKEEFLCQNPICLQQVERMLIHWCIIAPCVKIRWFPSKWSQKESGLHSTLG